MTSPKPPVGQQDDPDRICSRKGCGLPWNSHNKGFYGRRWCPYNEEKQFKEPVASPVTLSGEDMKFRESFLLRVAMEDEPFGVGGYRPESCPACGSQDAFYRGNIYVPDNKIQCYHSFHDAVTLSGEKFRKKPVVIEAMRWTGSNLEALKAWGAPVTILPATNGESLIIGTLEDGPNSEAVHVASLNDWIIRGVKNEFYPCKPDVFEITYDAVTLSEGQDTPTLFQEVEAHRKELIVENLKLKETLADILAWIRRTHRKENNRADEAYNRALSVVEMYIEEKTYRDLFGSPSRLTHRLRFKGR